MSCSRIARSMLSFSTVPRSLVTSARILSAFALVSAISGFILSSSSDIFSEGSFLTSAADTAAGHIAAVATEKRRTLTERGRRRKWGIIARWLIFGCDLEGDRLLHAGRNGFAALLAGPE